MVIGVYYPRYLGEVFNYMYRGTTIDPKFWFSLAINIFYSGTYTYWKELESILENIDTSSKA